ncbi:hypothetical protein chiPu_0025604 [Chiloscyllium punctatum]|uniref:Uncharacterized protein n=1 Tax=Chiloscyllium punctatum TaxID=137246 RepID=A0A401TGS7_CHIPU|nr:hypothetical protein [Chiloscyllium punctatum]
MGRCGRGRDRNGRSEQRGRGGAIGRRDNWGQGRGDWVEREAGTEAECGRDSGRSKCRATAYETGRDETKGRGKRRLRTAPAPD